MTIPAPSCLKQTVVLALMALFALSALGDRAAAGDEFVRTQGTQFVLDGDPFYVTGVNNHYLPWGSEGEVTRVLDDAVAMGANVVRTFLQPVIGSLDGTTVPTIWNFRNDQADSNNLNVHGMYLLYWNPAANSMAINDGDNSIQRIDFLVTEASKRRLRLIIAFLDFWDYTGGAQQMRAWYGSTDKNQFFFSDPRTRRDYKAWVQFVIERRNSLTGRVYRDDPTIMAWELINEPQAPLPMRNPWLATMAAHVKSLDPNHLVGSGEDRLNYANFEIQALDFVTWHGYPKYFGVTPAFFDRLIDRNCGLARQHNKPVVLEEFGYARSNTKPDQAQAYAVWLNTMRRNPDCAGWLVWRLVAQQDSGEYPSDTYDQFDVRNDGGATWNVLKSAARQGRSR